MVDPGGKTSTRSLQSRVNGLLYRHSGCRAGQRDALRIRMPASNPTLRMVWTLSPGGSSCGPGAIRARGGNGACRWRVTAPRSPRARGFGNGKFFGRAGCGETRRWRSSKSNAAIAAKRRSAAVAVGALVQHQEAFGHLDNFLLLTAWQLGDLSENLAEFAARRDRPARLWLAQ